MIAGAWVLGLLAIGPSETPRIAWTVPSEIECGSAATLERRITDLAAHDGGDLALQGHIEATDGLYRLDLSIETAEGRLHRSFTAERCTTLMEAAALMAATSLDATLVPEPQPKPVPAPLPAPVPAPSTPSAPTPAPPRTSPVDPPVHPIFSLRAGILHEGLPSPAVAPAGMIGIGIEAPKWRMQLDALGFGRRTEHVDVGVVGGLLRACAVFSVRSKLRLLPCGGFGVGAALGRGRNVYRASDAAVVWAAAQLGGQAVVQLWRRVGLVVDLGALIAITRPRFAISGGETLYRAGPAGGFALLGFEFRR